ncbi:MAG: hypothetical protein AB8H86_12785 [Polyangiales bacterium]
MSRPGLAKASRGAFLRSGVLSREAEVLLMRLITRLSEGSVRTDPAGDSYFGSTMFSVNLRALEDAWRGKLDREALRTAVEGSVRMRLRLMRLSAADAKQRVPDRIWGMTTSETRVALEGDSLHIDVDVEAPLDLVLGTAAQATSE